MATFRHIVSREPAASDGVRLSRRTGAVAIIAAAAFAGIGALLLPFAAGTPEFRAAGLTMIVLGAVCLVAAVLAFAAVSRYPDVAQFAGPNDLVGVVGVVVALAGAALCLVVGSTGRPIAIVLVAAAVIVWLIVGAARKVFRNQMGDQTGEQE